MCIFDIKYTHMSICILTTSMCILTTSMCILTTLMCIFEIKIYLHW